ncbi:MAG: hypothetical protein F4Z51_08845 [Chloroflexi bacterium]|nr:hypothetical protein [Chloroflexota bacterium]MYD16782.1 hypothetical protein [Chloroflexota bacterium]MYJ02552.1 hypothetical protein [Chloroflexota bacterium]
MTTNAEGIEIAVEYETAVPTAGGPDAADFAIRRPGHATLECALYLALDAKQAFEAACGPLSEGDVQSLIRVLGDALYRTQIGSGVEPLAIQTIRARDLSDDQFDSAIGAAGLTKLPSDE